MTFHGKGLEYGTWTVYGTVLFRSERTYQSLCVSYPLIPKIIKCRLPWILVQLIKLSMLLESTVCLWLAPVPSHTIKRKRKNMRGHMTTDSFSLFKTLKHIEFEAFKCLDGHFTFGTQANASFTLFNAIFLFFCFTKRATAHTCTAIHNKVYWRKIRGKVIYSTCCTLYYVS